MEVIALGGSALAALGAVAAAAFAWGQMHAARRSASAAEQSAQHAQRSADAAEEAVGHQRSEIERSQRAALVPPGELLDQMLKLDDDLGDIIAAGGKDSHWFLEAERREQRSRLDALAGQIIDDDLNTYLGNARSDYHHCWTMAPGHGVDNPTARSQQQTATARSARATLTKAIDRYNELVREAARPTNSRHRTQDDRVNDGAPDDN